MLATVTAVTLGTVAFVHSAQKEDERRMREAVHKDIARQKEWARKNGGGGTSGDERCDICELKPGDSASK